MNYIVRSYCYYAPKDHFHLLFTCISSEYDFHLPITYLQEAMEGSTFLVRYNGNWIQIHSRPFEPERMTTDVAWMQIKEGISAEEAYRRWFELQRRISRVLK
jgi:hypothetical protein